MLLGSVIIQCFETPRTLVQQASLSMGLSRQEYWSEQPFPSSGDLLGPGIKPGSPALQTDSLLSGPPGKPLLLGRPSLGERCYLCLLGLCLFEDRLFLI